MKLRRFKRGKPALPLYNMPPREIFNKAFIKKIGEGSVASTYLGRYVNCDELYDEVNKAILSTSRGAIAWSESILFILKL